MLGLYPISGFGDALGVSAVGAAKKALIMLDSMAYYSAATMEAGGGKGLNRAFKAIEGIGSALQDDIKRFVVGVVADEAGSHSSPMYGGRLGEVVHVGNEGAQGGRIPWSNFRASGPNYGESKYIAKPIGRF